MYSYKNRWLQYNVVCIIELMHIQAKANLLDVLIQQKSRNQQRAIPDNGPDHLLVLVHDTSVTLMWREHGRCRH